MAKVEEDKAKAATAAADSAEPAAKVKILKVRSLLKAERDGGFPVALYEVDRKHPGQPSKANATVREGQYEAYVAGPAVVEVAETPAVSQAIRDGKIEVVSD